MEITYRNIIDGTKREYKDGLGKKIKDKYTFVIKPTEYLTNFKIWYADDSIYRIYLQTNKGKEKEKVKEKYKIGKIEKKIMKIY